MAWKTIFVAAAEESATSPVESQVLLFPAVPKSPPRKTPVSLKVTLSPTSRNVEEDEDDDASVGL